MKDFYKKLNKELANTRLAPEERASMRARVLAHMKMHPIQSPRPSFFYSFQFASASRYAFASLLIVLLVGGSTVSAAAGALPGDILYTVKITVNEQVEQVLTRGDAEKAGVHAKLAQRRLEEAEALAVLGKLDAGAAAEIENNFDAHMERIGILSQTLEIEDPGTAAEVSIKLDSSLEVHGAILARLGEESGDSDTKEHSGRISARLLARTESSARYFGASDTRGKVAAQVESKTPETATLSRASSAAEDTSVAPPYADAWGERIALQLQKKALEALEEAHESYDDVEDELATTTIARVEAQFDAAGAHMREGNDAFAKGDFSLAVENFTKAFRIVVQLDAFLEAQERFERNFISAKFEWNKGDDFYDDERGGDDGEKGRGEDDDRDEDDDKKDSRGNDDDSNILPIVRPIL